MFFNLDIVNSDQLLNIMDAQIQFVEFVEVEANVCSCTDEIKKIEEEIQAHTIQHERLNKEYYENLIAHLKKDVAIRQLKQKKNKHKNQFNDFRGVFSPSAIKELESMIGTSAKVSTFVLKALTNLYHDELPRLKQKTYSGRSKEALTPEKSEILKKLLTKRIDLEEENVEIGKQRKLRFGKHVKTGIENINNRYQESNPQN